MTATELLTIELTSIVENDNICISSSTVVALPENQINNHLNRILKSFLK